MTWIIILILVGILLVFVEVFFVPGTTIVGVLGFIFAGIAIGMAYKENNSYGNWMLIGSALFFIIAIVIGAKSGVWQKLSNKSAITSKVELVSKDSVKVGEKGQAISAIRPGGKARINGKNYEVKSYGEYIASGASIEVIKITGNIITVKQSDEAEDQA